MIINDYLRMVYLAIPRTGSFSITNTICQAYPDTKKMGHHRMDVPQICIDRGYHIWSVARNPYLRVLSHYRYRMQTHTKIMPDWSFEKYVDYTVNERFGELKIINDPPAMRWPRPHYPVRFVRFEDLHQAWPLLPFWTTSAPELMHINHSTLAVGAYTQELAEKVYQYHKVDFDRFNYDPESWRLVSDSG